LAIQLRLQLEPEAFEGPLELLLLLIEQRRLPITRVSLAQVADQYLAQVHALPSIEPDLLAEFLSIGSRLLLLKSRALLIVEVPDPEVEEVASDLTERLATYRVFRAAADVLRELEARGERSYPSQREPLVTLVEPALLPTSPETLRTIMRRLLADKAGPEQMELPGSSRASVETRRALILDLLRMTRSVSFQSIAGTTVDEVIATFLAVLELYRRGLIEVAQAAPFADLEIAPRAGVAADSGAYCC
jgi:segregation and condensation protein A